MRASTVVLSVSLLAAFSAQAQSGPATGSMHVLATDHKGTPLPTAQVAYRRIVRLAGTPNHPIPAPGEAVVHKLASTDANGALSPSGLPAGDCVLCGAVPSRPYLDPCEWATPPKVTVAPNASAGATLVLTKGVLLKVRVIDPQRLLPRSLDGPQGGGRLVVGVKFGNGAYLGAQNTAVSGVTREYEMPIPANQQLYLWLFSRHVALNDASGNAVDVSGKPIPLRATAGADQVLVFTVSGPLANSH